MSYFDRYDLHVWTRVGVHRLVERSVMRTPFGTGTGRVVEVKSYAYQYMPHLFVRELPVIRASMGSVRRPLSGEQRASLAVLPGDVHAYTLCAPLDPPMRLAPDAYRGDTIQPVTITHAAVFDRRDRRAVHGWVDDMAALYAACDPDRYVLVPVMPDAFPQEE